MYENVQKEKDTLVGRLATMEAEMKSVRDELASYQESSTAALKVSVLTPPFLPPSPHTHTHPIIMSLICWNM